MTDYKYIIGCDECGLGSLAHSVVVTGLKAPPDWQIPGLNDSKKLSPKKRKLISDQLLKLAEDKVISYHIAERSHLEIDRLGIATALKDCYVEVFHALYQEESLIICDGTLKFNNLGVDHYPKQSVIKADSKFPTVMAASIIGKHYRDMQMLELDKEYPAYDWVNNMGYPSPKHKAAIESHGPCPLHRRSYAPMKNMNLPDPRQLTLPFTE